LRQEDPETELHISSDPKGYIDSEIEYSAVLLDMFCLVSTLNHPELTSN